MAQNVNPTFVKTPNVQVTQFTTTNGANFAQLPLYTGGVNGSKVTSLLISANTSAPTDMRISIAGPTGGNGYINTVSVTSQAGFASAGGPPINGFGSPAFPIDSDGNQYLFLASSGWVLQAQITSTSSSWTATSFMSVTVTAGDF